MAAPTLTAAPSGPVARVLTFVRFSHTLFALPFALGSMLVAAHGRPGWRVCGLILLCMVFARTAAMVFNRLADWEIDKKNPRTAGRHRLVARPVAVALLILSAAAFHRRGMHGVAEIQDAYRLLPATLSALLAGGIFAVALLASGQNSTLTGTLAGQIVMEGFLHLRLRPWLRRRPFVQRHVGQQRTRHAHPAVAGIGATEHAHRRPSLPPAL